MAAVGKGLGRGSRSGHCAGNALPTHSPIRVGMGEGVQPCPLSNPFSRPGRGWEGVQDLPGIHSIGEVLDQLLPWLEAGLQRVED